MSKLNNIFAILDSSSDDEDDIGFSSIKRTRSNHRGKFHSVSKSFDVEIEKVERKAVEKPERKVVEKSKRKVEKRTRKSEDNIQRNIEQDLNLIGKETKTSSKLDSKVFNKPKPNLDSKIYSGLKFSSTGVLDEFSGLPDSIDEAIRLKRNLTLKQITSIVQYDGLRLNGLCGEMFNVIHDRIQLKVRRHRIKITHQGRVFLVSLYNWYDLKKIEKMIEEIVFG
jgi:hypothetical protein